MGKDDEISLEALADPQILDNFIDRAATRAGMKGFRAMADDLGDRRGMCQDRGYHRVSEEKETSDNELNDVMICYDCDLWFTKKFAQSCDFEYKVEPW